MHGHLPTKRSGAWEEGKEGAKGGRELSSHLGGRKEGKGGKGGRELSSHPIAIHVGKDGDFCWWQVSNACCQPARRGGEEAAAVVDPELAVTVITDDKEIERLGGERGGWG